MNKNTLFWTNRFSGQYLSTWSTRLIQCFLLQAQSLTRRKVCGRWSHLWPARRLPTDPYNKITRDESERRSGVVGRPGLAGPPGRETPLSAETDAGSRAPGVRLPHGNCAHWSLLSTLHTISLRKHHPIWYI